MKRFIQSSIENLSIEVNSISEIRIGSESKIFGASSKTYEGYIVSVTTTYGRTIEVGVYNEESVAIAVSGAIKLACVKDMLEPVANQYQKYGVWINYGSSTVMLPISTERREPKEASRKGLVDFSKITPENINDETVWR